MNETTRDATAPATAGELLELVRTGRASTRSDLRRLTGLSRTAVVSRVSALTSTPACSLLGEELASTGGRPPGTLVFNSDAGVVLGVAIGRSRSQLAIFDLEGAELAADSDDHEVGVGPDALMPEVAARLAELLRRRGHPGGRRRAEPARHRRHGPRRQRRLAGDGRLGRRRARAVPRRGRRRPALRRPTTPTCWPAPSCSARPAALRDALVVKASTGLGLGIIADGPGPHRPRRRHRRDRAHQGRRRRRAGLPLRRHRAASRPSPAAGRWSARLAESGRRGRPRARPGGAGAARATPWPAACCATAAGSSARCSPWRSTCSTRRRW